MFTECEAADLKGLCEEEGGRESCSQALAACINPEGNGTQGYGMEEHPSGTSPACRARPRRGWLCAVLALGAAAVSPAEPSARLHQISAPVTSRIPKGRELRTGNPIAWHPHPSHPQESVAGPVGKFRLAGTSGEKAKEVLEVSAGTSGDGDLGEEALVKSLGGCHGNIPCGDIATQTTEGCLCACRNRIQVVQH